MNNLIIPDIAYLIESGKIENEYTVLKELEETIIDLYEKNGTSEIFQNELLLLIELEKINKFNINSYNELNLSEFKFDKSIKDNMNNIVLTGPYIRSIFIDKLNLDEIKKEVFINCINNIDPKGLINSSYSETNDMYFKNTDNYCLYIMKKTYRNPSEIILSNYNLKRIGIYKGKTYISPMFIADYIRFIDSINSNQIDPVFKTKLDLFDILKHNHPSDNINIFD